MSSSINWSSILGKAKKYMGRADAQKRIEKVVDNVMLNFVSKSGNTLFNPSDAAQRFIEVLQDEIHSHAGMTVSDGGLGATAVESLTRLEHGSPVKVGKNSYQISISFSDNLHRDSLYSSGYPDGVENIAALLNTGYTADKRVYGTWHGKKIGSLQDRSGARFIESAIRTFMANDAKNYGVVDIEVDDIYK